MIIFSDYHQSGANTVLRVGDTSSDSSKAGVFHATMTAEITLESHGTGTVYCGRVFYCEHHGSETYYYISTGIGQYGYVNGPKHVESDCLSVSGNNYFQAHCNANNSRGSCPLGWGNCTSYQNFQTGCYKGTYYPNPTPASNTNIYTGSHVQRTNGYMVENHRNDIVSIQTNKLRTAPFTTGDRRTRCL